MATIRFLSVLLGALAVLCLGALGSPAMATDDAARPCHEMAASPDTGDEPSPSGAMKAMGCCIACVSVALPQPAARSLQRGPEVTHSARPAALPHGEIPAPEHGPPRALVS